MIGVLGEGGSATVYDARWGHRSVALKVVRADLGPAEQRRFLDEARLLIDMAHPGVVKVLSAGALPDGRAYLVMEKLPGQTLASRLADGALPLATAVAVFAQLGLAVAAMHDAGLIHRDLKPENVMLIDDGAAVHAVLLDFGIAKAMVDGVVTLTETGQVRGTPAYMAPERFFGAPAAVATDVYELAVTLFAMIAGRLPWDDTADPDVRLNPARLADLAEVPAALDEVVARALSTRAGNRPSDVRTLCTQVEAAAGVKPGSSARVTAPVDIPLASAPTVSARAVAPVASSTPSPGQPWRQPSGAVTTGSAASGERVERSEVARAPRRRRWPLLVGGVATLAAAAVVTALVIRRDGDRRPSPQAPDPWAVPAVAVTTPVAGEGLPRNPAPVALAQLELTSSKKAEVRAALSDALRHHSPKATVVVGLSLAEIRASEAMRPALDTADASAALTQMRMLFVGACELELSARGQWMTLALVERPGTVLPSWELIASGDWTRDELEPCLGKGRPGKVSRRGAPGLDGEPITVVPTDGLPVLVGWLDDHTFIVNSDLVGVDEIAPRLAVRAGKPSPLDEIGSRIDRATSAWIIGTAAAVKNAVDTPALATDFTMRLELDAQGLTGALALYTPDRKRADAAAVAAQALLDQLKENRLLAIAIPALALERDGTTVRLRGQLPADLLSKFGKELASALP